jgi:hypothetical protein
LSPADVESDLAAIHADLALLDPLRISVATPAADPVDVGEMNHKCICFRHTGWSHARTRVLTALSEAGINAIATHRFATCGAHAWVQRSVEPTPRYRVVADFCQSRWCVPCSRHHTRIVASNLMRHLEGRPTRLLTLTLRQDGAGLAARIERLQSAFRRLRQSPFWKTHVCGGVSFFQTTFTPETRNWHTHLHVICDGRYVPRKLLSDAWLRATGDSFIVDVRLVRNDAVAGYVARYTARPYTNELIGDPVALKELIAAMEHQRCFTTFGTWRSLGLSKPIPDGAQWVDLSPLSCILERAKAGDADAEAVLRRLTQTTDLFESDRQSLFDSG